MKEIYQYISICLVGFICLSYFFLGFCPGMEAYNPIKPDIDTEYAKNYNEVKFNRLKIGMDSTKVIEEIGYPIYIRNLKENIQLWYYTRDNKCKGLDFAWLLRAIEIDENGKILSVKKAIVYD